MLILALRLEKKHRTSDEPVRRRLRTAASLRTSVGWPL